MKNSLLILASAFLLSSNISPLKADISPVDKSFLMTAAQGGMTEVELGKLAASRGTSQDVKNFGGKMVADHSKANDELKTIAVLKGITLPKSLDAQHQDMYDKLSALSGNAFDETYILMMVTAHKKDDALFSKEASTGTDSDLKAFAGKTDGVVKEHLSMVKQIQSKIK